MLSGGGVRAAELERKLRAVRWNAVFAARVERKLPPQRRKAEDFELSPLIAPGLKNGALVAHTGAVSSRGLESLLRRYTLPVRGVTDFDRRALGDGGLVKKLPVDLARARPEWASAALACSGAFTASGPTACWCAA